MLKLTGHTINILHLGNAVEIDIAVVTGVVTGQQLTTSLNSVTIDLNTPVNLTTENLATLSLGSISVGTNRCDCKCNWISLDRNY